MGENQLTHTNLNLRIDYAEGGSEPSRLPAEALFYALPYMNLRELLSVEQVCKASRHWVREDVFLWRTLCVEWPLSNRLTDEILIQLSKRSNSELECLCLVDCLRITEWAVEQIIMASPRLTKLFLPGCTQITAEGVLNMVRAHTNQKGPGMPGIKQLKLRSIIGLTEQHVQSLLDITDAAKVSRSGLKPRYYNDYHEVLSCDDQRPIDVEVCPKCSDVRVIFDCLRDACQEKQECRACLFCTSRCADCGVCLKDDERDDTVCCDNLCSNCWLKLPKCSHCNRAACGRHSSTSFEVQEGMQLCSECVYFLIAPRSREYDL